MFKLISDMSENICDNIITVGGVLNAYPSDCEWCYTSQIVILMIANCLADLEATPSNLAKGVAYGEAAWGVGY